ncbi:bifunctional transcriptional activator/DNA repair enzyme AdaA [Robiginitomaculum antarcticum]|uniref:bifunctional transcriptional activator/DNA repair enzyme AdaA n=1 Tax=Robiginitomaculum antarcticum TaxID=437507 RepID=UPI00036980E2|nr:bifunctional transcriptional activator/DNA repair protein Ada [Robiginitomaculum antarcticum]
MKQTLTDIQKYGIIAAKDKAYDGLFFVGVLSTGIFCRPGCPARVPNPENCQYYDNAAQALKAGFRACKKCHPASFNAQDGPLVRRLITMVEDNPETLWREADLVKAGIDPSTARRQFKRRFGMSFSAYGRARRLALGLKTLAEGGDMIEAQLASGYESESGFRKAFGDTFGGQGHSPLGAAGPKFFVDWIETPFGTMIAVTDAQALYLLEFTDRTKLDRQMHRVANYNRVMITPGRTPVHDQIAEELKQYFAGELTEFNTPIAMSGTDFQKATWHALRRIPHGQTQNYAGLANDLGKPTAFRAVANSNANNALAIVVPCHRVIAKDGTLGGYAGGLERKAALLDLEGRD